MTEESLSEADLREAWPALSAEGRLLVFPLEEVKELASGGKGVMAMRLHEGESMIGLRAVKDAIEIARRRGGGILGPSLRPFDVVEDDAQVHLDAFGGRVRDGRWRFELAENTLQVDRVRAAQG